MVTTIRFTKMHGLGNDFVVVNALDVPLPSLPIAQLANRHMGIGFDQLLVIEKSHRADFFCRIFNADGSEAEQCGNGLRCIARFLHEESLHAHTALTLETKAGIFSITITDYEHIRIVFNPPTVQEPLINLVLANQQIFSTSILSLGNPHAIVKVDSIEKIIPNELGSAISSHAFFPQGANVGFMQVINKNHIRLRTFERGVGETHACGSNACAAVCAGRINGWLQQNVEVQYRYGNLFIEWAGDDHPVYMTGPASRVFSGNMDVTI